MKYLAFALVISSLILSSSEAQEEGHEKPYLDFWNNWLTPQQYAEQLNYVQNVMKDESEAEGTFKGKRREIFEAQKWKCVGPNVVRVLNGDRSVNSDIVFHGRVRALKWYNDPSLGWELYLAASSGGLWIGHTTIFVGRIWNSLGDNLPNQSVGAFDIKPGDPKTIFVGTGDFQRFTGAGLYKTTNRGLSWTKVPLRFASGALIYNDPDSFTDLFYDPTDASIMWLSSTFGVFKSTDGGITWLQVPVDTTAPNQTVHDLVIDPSDHNRLYAAFGFPGPARLIWRTSNGGTNWQRADAGLPTTNLGRTIALDISSSNPLVLYAAVSDAKLQLRGIYKTTDRGTTWNPTSSQPYDYMGGQAHDKNVIRVHPTDANIVYAGSIGFIKSTDGGASWTVPNRGHDDQTVIDFDPIDLSKMYVAGDGGVFRYDDAANAVRNVDEIFAPGSIIQSYSLDYAASKTTVMIGGTQDNGTLVTEQGGTESASWTMFSGCDGGNHVSISPATSAEFFFNSWCGKHHPRLRSLDRGATVDDINSGLIDTNLYYTPISLGKKVVNLLFTVSPTTLYYSTDKGNNWLPAHGVSQNLDPSEGIRGIAAGGYGATIVCYAWFWGDASKVKVAHGTPGSMTWSERNLPGNRTVGQGNFANSGIRADRFYPYTAYAFEGTAPYRMYKTTNTGISWTEITGTDLGGVLPSARKYDIASSPVDPSIMYVGTDFGVFKTTNNGGTWYKFQWGLPTVPVTNVVLIPGTSGDPDSLRIGTFGRGYWQRVLSGDDSPFSGILADFPVHGIDVIGDHGIAVGEDGRVAHTSDGGKTWAEGASSVSSTLNSSRILDSLRRIAVGLLGAIVRSTDGGSSWSTIPSPVLSSFFDVFFTDPLNGSAVGDLGTVIHSADGGQTWQTTMTGTNKTFHSVFFTDPLNGWISGTDNTGQISMIVLLHTTDGGGNWIPSQSVGPGGGCDVMFPDPLNGYLTLEGGGMMKTTDGGQSWNQLQTGTQLSLHDVFFTNPDNGWACGDGGVFIHTTNGGQQWMTEESGTDSNLYRLAMSSDHLFTAGEEGVFSKSTETTTEVAHSLTAGWNLISVPVQYTDYSTPNVYPSAVSSAFAFQGTYNPVSVLTPGDGYWLKFDADVNAGHIGPPLTSLIVPVHAQWNIIGSLSTPISVGSITSTPQNIVISNFFGYNNGYQIADTLEPGNAYWVKTSQNGQLTLSSTVNRLRLTPKIKTNTFDSYNTITVVDAAHKQQTLWFSGNVIDPQTREQFVLPPLPPDSGFDVRFASNRFLESTCGEGDCLLPIEIRSGRYPITVRWDIKEEGMTSALVVNGRHVLLRASGNITVSSASANVGLLLHRGISQPLPTEYALEQNYPNPFNPTTVIRYQLPELSRVSLKVYDMLGQEVAKLVDLTEEAGFSETTWDASGVSSGVYFYRLQATSTIDPRKSITQVKKLVILK